MHSTNVTCSERRLTAYFFSGGAGLILVVGVVACVASIVVWTSLIRRDRRVTVTVWATLLVVIESTNLFVLGVVGLRYVFPAFMVGVGGLCDAESLIGHWAKFWRQAFPFIFAICYPLEQAALFAHQWIHLLLSTERYVHFCQPFKIGRQFTKRRALVGVAIIVATSTACCVPYWLEYRVKPLGNVSCDGLDFCAESSQTSLREDPCYILLYRVAFHVIVKYAAPWTLVTLQTVATIRVLKRIASTVSVVGLDDSSERSSITSVSSTTSLHSISSAALSLSQIGVVGVRGVASAVHRLSGASFTSIAPLHQIGDEGHQRKVTRLCFAIVFVFFLCQFPHGLWLAISGITLPYGPGFRTDNFRCLESPGPYRRVEFVDGGAGVSGGVGSTEPQGEQRLRGWTAPSAELPMWKYYRFDKAIEKGSFILEFLVDFDCDLIRGFRFDVVVAPDAACSDWQQPTSPQRGEENFSCRDGRMRFQFDAGDTSCFGVKATRSHAPYDDVNVTMTDAILRRRDFHKNLANIVFQTLQDYAALGTAALLLLTPIVDLIVFFRFYAPFEAEFRRVVLKRVGKG